jgi:hypothetical protein
LLPFRRLPEGLRLRGYAPKAIGCHVAAVARFALHFGRSPDQPGAGQLRRYQP